MGMEDNMAITTGNLCQKVPLSETNLTDPNILHDSESEGVHRTSRGMVYVKCGDVTQPMKANEYIK